MRTPGSQNLRPGRPCATSRRGSGTKRHDVQLNVAEDDTAQLHNLAQHLLGDPHRADDAVQDTLLAAINGASSPVRDTGAWLRGVLRRVSANARRADHVRRVRETRGATLDQHHSHFHVEQDRVVDRERAADVALAIDELDEPYRVVVRLTYFEELDSVQVARRLGVAPATVRTRLHRARATLRDRLSAQHGPASVALFPWFGSWFQRGTHNPIAATAQTGVGLSLAAKVAASVVLSLSLAVAFMAADGTVVAIAPASEAPPTTPSFVATTADDIIERAQQFPPPDPWITHGQPMSPASALRRSTPFRSTPFRSDARARLARFEHSVGAPFLLYHDLPTWLRRHAPRYGLFLKRRGGDIAILDLRDEHNHPVLIDANVRHLAESMLFEYDAQLVAQEAYVAQCVTDGGARLLQAGSIPTIQVDANKRGVIVDSHRDGRVTVVDIDDAFLADRAARSDRLEDLRQRLAVDRAVLAVTPAKDE